MKLTQAFSFGYSGVFLLSFLGQNIVKILNKVKFCQILHTKTHFAYFCYILSSSFFSWPRYSKVLKL